MRGGRVRRSRPQHLLRLGVLSIVDGGRHLSGLFVKDCMVFDALLVRRQRPKTRTGFTVQPFAERATIIPCNGGDIQRRLGLDGATQLHLPFAVGLDGFI